MDKWFHPTHYNGCNYLSMPWLKLIHVSKRGYWSTQEKLFRRLLWSWHGFSGRRRGLAACNLRSCKPALLTRGTRGTPDANLVFQYARHSLRLLAAYDPIYQKLWGLLGRNPLWHITSHSEGSHIQNYCERKQMKIYIWIVGEFLIHVIVVYYGLILGLHPANEKRCYIASHNRS